MSDKRSKGRGASYDGRFVKSKQMQDLMAIHLRELFPTFEVKREVAFCSDRKWRFDLAVDKLAIEIEGGVWVEGAHTRGMHFMSDMEKYNRATLAGWRVLRFTPQQVNNGYAKSFIEEYLQP
jgi:very-short-patch-repair endonuclease